MDILPMRLPTSGRLYEMTCLMLPSTGASLGMVRLPLTLWYNIY